MTTQTEALKLALEAFTIVRFCVPPAQRPTIERAIAAVKEALQSNEQLEQERCVGCEACIDTACGRDECPKGWPKAAQPEQEPVAWMNVKRDMTYLHGPYNADDIPLYTTKPQRTWVDLTEEEIYAAIRSTRFPSTDITVSQSVIEAFKEKNK